MKQATKQRERSFAITFLTVLSSLSVVILHANGVFWRFSYERVWLTANVLESVFYFAVPVFFMISGTTLLDYRDYYDTKTYAWKRIKKTVIPFVLWSVLALIFKIIIMGYTVEPATVYGVLDTIINSKHWNVYWFFMPLFGAYLLIPVISLIPKENRQSIFLYVIVVGYLLNELIPFINRLFGPVIPVSSKLSFPLTSSLLIYLFVGYYIYHFSIARKVRLVIYGLGVLGLAAHIIGTWYCSYQAGEVVSLFKGYTNLPGALYSTAIFLFFRYFNFDRVGNKVKRALEYVSSETFNVYLIHMFVLNMTTKVFHVTWNSFFSRTVGAFLVFLGICLVCKQLKKWKPFRLLLT